MTSDGQIRTVPLAVWRDAKIDGSVLREARKAAGLSQKELALEHLAVDPRTISLWERNESTPQPGHRARLAEVLDLDLELPDE